MMPQATYRLAALVLVVAALTGSAQAQEARLVPVTIDGEGVRLEMRVYEPANGVPAPTLVFNHGSTGAGTDARAFTRPLDFPEVAARRGLLESPRSQPMTRPPITRIESPVT